MKPDVAAAPLPGYGDEPAPVLLRASRVRRLLAETWWLVCLLPAAVLLAVAATA